MKVNYKMSQKVLGGGLLVGVGYVLYQLFNNDENKEVNSDLELKDTTKNILKGKNDFDLKMEKVDLDKEINTEVEPKSSVEENSVEVTQFGEENTEQEVKEEKPVQEVKEETTEQEVKEETTEQEVKEVKQVKEVKKVKEVKEETSLEDLPTDDSNTIERIVRI